MRSSEADRRTTNSSTG